MHLQSSRPSSGVAAPKQLHRGMPSPGRPAKTRMRCRLAVLKGFLLRVDVSLSIAYLLILLCVAVPVVVVSQVYLTRTLVTSWRTVHNTRVYYITERISISTISVHNIANGFMALNILGERSYTDHDLMENLCSSLDNYDKLTRFRALSLVSLETESTISCIHGIPTMDSMRTLTGYVSYNNMINGTYLIDNGTYDFVQPLQMVAEWPESARNISAATTTTYSGAPILELLPAYLDGSVGSVDSRHHWILPEIMPHIICYILPVGYLARGRTDISGMSYTDFTQVLLDGSRMLLDYDFVEAPGLAMAAFINQSLADDDPLVLSNSWGQPSVSNDSIYSIFTAVPVTYLKASNISDPLMRAALKHVDLAALQEEGYRRSVNFEYAGAAAFVTAYAYTTAQGLVVPLVVASSHAAITTPYLLLMRIFDAILAAVILLLTGASFNSARCLISQPLRRITALMLASMSAGRRALFYTTTSSTLLQLTEVHALIKAHNAAMQQLREIDAFVLDELSAEGRAQRTTSSVSNIASSMGTSQGRKGTKLGSRCLATHLSTAVFLIIQPPSAPSGSQAVLSLTAAPPPILAEHGEQKPLRGQRLVSVVRHAAQAANTANSGPFPTPAALTAFITAVYELCHTHHGTLHRLCPDACVLHFNSAVRAHLSRGPGDASAAAAPPAPAPRHGVPAAQSAPQPRPPRATRQEEMRRRAAQDARSAAAFALDLVSWTAAQGGSGESAQTDGASAMPDVRALLDTSMFTCGQYRPAGSEQTLQVALGRDVQRDLGRVPQRIGVRVAMTEETATLLRADDDSGGRGRGHVDAGVRQIPVDVLRTGRAGLDGDVVVLYEALPGRVAGDAAWQQYARCCCDGFEHMLRGDYAGALAAYRGVAEIADLEPGLLPAAMRREAAASAVTGGAVSVQAARLMRECERRVRLRITEPLCKVRFCPLGIDAVRRDSKPLGNGTGGRCPGALSPTEEDVRIPQNVRGREANHSGFSRISTQRFPRVQERYVLAVKESTSTLRCVVPSMPSWMRDEHGLHWHIARCPINGELTPELMWHRRVLALGSAGALCSVNYLIYREVHPVVAKAIRNAQPGPMSDALRSATPVCGPSSRQAAAVRRLIKRHQQLRHPNLLSFLGFSESLEGGVVLLWEFSPGGTLRELIFRYPNVKPVTINRFGLQILTALSYLHERGVAHGSVRLDNVLVSADGKCRLTGHSGDNEAACELFHMRQTCFMSPLMATGALPTPQCDMFCIGLGALEALTKQPAWKWATGDDGQPLGTPAELAELMKAGGTTFSSALVQGRVVVNVDPLRGASVASKYSNRVVESLIRCLSLDPAERPTAMQVREASKEMLLQAGLTLEEDELAASFPLMMRD